MKKSGPRALIVPQPKLFEQAARELGCDDDPAHFDEVLKKVARHKPAHEGPKDSSPPEEEKPGRS